MRSISANKLWITANEKVICNILVSAKELQITFWLLFPALFETIKYLGRVIKFLLEVREERPWNHMRMWEVMCLHNFTVLITFWSLNIVYIAANRTRHLFKSWWYLSTNMLRPFLFFNKYTWKRWHRVPM